MRCLCTKVDHTQPHTGGFKAVTHTLTSLLAAPYKFRTNVALAFVSPTRTKIFPSNLTFHLIVWHMV